MTIRIAAVGKLKERFWQEALREYEKRLSRYADVRIFEVADEPAPEHISGKEKAAVLQKEGDRLLKKIPEGSYCIALAVRGRRFSSESFAEELKEKMDRGVSDITFVIGGSLGLSPEVMDRADLSMSFSDLTFPHQLMRVILAEQIYRAFRIMRGEPYHK